jgi:hypothetical protein
MYLQKNKHENFDKKNLFFAGILSATDEKNSIRIRSRIRIRIRETVARSAADPNPGSGAFLTPGSGIRNGFFPDPGSRIPGPKATFLRV